MAAARIIHHRGQRSAVVRAISDLWNFALCTFRLDGSPRKNGRIHSFTGSNDPPSRQAQFSEPLLGMSHASEPSSGKRTTDSSRATEMRLGSFVWLSAGAALAMSAAMACQQPIQASPYGGRQQDESQNEPEDEDPAKGNESTPGKGKKDNTCLGRASLAFDDVACNKCMSDSAQCCQATITCFKDDADCSALHAC